LNGIDLKQVKPLTLRLSLFILVIEKTYLEKTQMEGYVPLVDNNLFAHPLDRG
jgi:hypothetical protein